MKRRRKVFALVCLSTILYQTFSPLTALALTSGPASPDASSFEPVDTSTMVNPVTGDLVYNVPLIEVPGPEGSYPLSLSYHAGINPEQESSWVGLGWTLNPGAISRSVNGFPDDWANTDASRRDYWAGGVTEITSVGITVPIMNYGSINLGLVKASDTYKGVGYGWNVGGSFGVGGQYSPFSVNVGIGSNPFSSGLTLSGGIGIGFDMLGNSSLSIGGSVGENNSVGISASAPYGILSASLSSNAGFSFSTPGYSGKVSNGKEGVVSTHTKESSLNLVLFSRTHTRTRYWTDEVETSNIYGALNPKYFSSSSIGDLSDNIAGDSYHIPQSSYSKIDPEKEQGGAFPAFDNYIVTGQGIGGIIRPFMYQGSIVKQNLIERDISSRRKTIQYNGIPSFPNSIGFRFVGDFSNSLLQDYPAFTSDAASIRAPNIPFSSIARKVVNGVENYQNIDNTLIGSKSITYFQRGGNGNIVAQGGQSKFIAPNALGLDRSKHSAPMAENAVAAGIAGFAITNENGITYHYNLPAQNYDEESYQENNDKSSGLRFNRQTKSAGYAYTWHLTAITGPDYVDRGIIGVLDEADYGYWVSFEYGKWNNEFVWRTPAEGFTPDFDNDFRSVSMGKREIYYLNAIRTRTHTALFEKEARIDGKSSSVETFNKNWSSQNNVSTDYTNEGLYNVNSTQSLRLSHVYIVKNGTVSDLGAASGGSNGLVSSGRTVACAECELPNNVLDINDVNSFGRSTLEAKSLRVIDLNYDYSLAKGSVTSFNFTNPSSKQGKLTLKSLKVRGKGGVSYLPATEFGYELSAIEQNKGYGTIGVNAITGATSKFEVGDLVETDEASPIYCGYVDQVTQTGSTYSYVIKGGAGSSLGYKGIRRTKNPPYQNNKYDYWGMYKADFYSAASSNLSRIPTKASNASTDVWSLRTVKTLTGTLLNFEFEGHDFENVKFGNNWSIKFSTYQKLSPGNYRFTIDGNSGREPKDFFQVGDKLSAIFLKNFQQKSENQNPSTWPSVYDIHEGSDMLVTALNGASMDVSMNSSLENDLFQLDYVDRTQASLIVSHFSPNSAGKRRYGGAGVRVKAITIKAENGVKNRTEYRYLTNNNISSSGTVVYEPLVYEKFPNGNNYSLNKPSEYNQYLNDGLFDSSRFGAELPGPSVMYSRVETFSQILYPDGSKTLPSESTVSEFFSFKDLKISLDEVSPSVPSGGNYSTRNIALRKFVSLLGSPKSISYYDGNGKLVKRIVQKYLHDDLSDDFFATYKARLAGIGYQGLITERFSEVKNVYSSAYSKMVQFGTMVAREEYPLVNIGTVEYDYIHNTKTSSRVNAFDFYSGAVTESINTDSYGNSFLSESKPAYSEFAGMGPNLRDNTMKNMLTQVSANNVYRLNASGGKEYLVSASYNLWSNGGSVLDGNGNRMVQNNAATNGNVWRQTAGYVWIPSSVDVNGMTAVANFAPFPGTNPSGANAAWKRNSETVLMDGYSHVLSTRDFKGNHVSTRYGYNSAKPVLSSTFAKYGEIAFSGAEDENISNGKKLEVNKGAGTVSTSAFHTGSKSLQLGAGQIGFDYSVPVSELTAGRTYTASVWVNNQTAHNVKIYYTLDGVQKTVSGASTVSARTSGSWTLITFDITLSGGTTVRVFAKNDGTGTSYVDDFRFQPKNSVSSASVYDNVSGELIYSLDRNNLYTRYEYNAMGQVIATYREQFGRTPYKVSETQLNYSTKSFNGLSN
ncbi:hypothetical protein GCM10009120_26740 [Sphingobacterium siyangense subsp. cladoniae]|uniref:chitobiase/beta-hexosaminidase C-terminal domain-containing protein n=1 Tax=Sphingobacterium siyangense TaxID=459529 RepID=UPI0031F86C6A